MLPRCTVRAVPVVGLDGSASQAFRDAVVLYALFDVDLFHTASDLRGRDRYLACQVSLLEAICTEA